MTIREVISKMTTIVGKVDPLFKDTVAQFCSDLSECRADLIATSSKLACPSMGKPTINLSPDYIRVFLDKFEKVDAMIAKLASNASTPSRCAVTEEEFKGLNLKDIGIDNVVQPPAELTIWKEGTEIPPEVRGHALRMNAYNLNGVLCSEGEFGPIIEEPHSECGLKFEDNTGRIHSMCVAPRDSTSNWIEVVLKRDDLGPSPVLITLGIFLPKEDARVYLETITDIDPTSKSYGVDCKLMNRTVTYWFIHNPIYFRVARIFIEYANRGQTILNFDKFLEGNFGSQASTDGMDALLTVPLVLRNDKTATIAECLTNRIINESKELDSAEVCVDNLVNPRQLEMLASLFAVKFSLLKILYGHVRRTK